MLRCPYRGEQEISHHLRGDEVRHDVRSVFPGPRERLRGGPIVAAVAKVVGGDGRVDGLHLLDELHRGGGSG